MSPSDHVHTASHLKKNNKNITIRQGGFSGEKQLIAQSKKSHLPQPHKGPSLVWCLCACVCLISLNSAWLALCGTLLLKPLAHINHHHKVTNSPVTDKAVRAALNTTLIENNYCYKNLCNMINLSLTMPQSKLHSAVFSCCCHMGQNLSWGCGPWSFYFFVLFCFFESLSFTEGLCYWVTLHTSIHTITQKVHPWKEKHWVATCPSFSVTHIHFVMMSEQWNNTEDFIKKDPLKYPRMLFGFEEKASDWTAQFSKSDHPL